jgi:hypothetical protein
MGKQADGPKVDTPSDYSREVLVIVFLALAILVLRALG